MNDGELIEKAAKQEADKLAKKIAAKPKQTAEEEAKSLDDQIAKAKEKLSLAKKRAELKEIQKEIDLLEGNKVTVTWSEHRRF